jgi:uncharacterized protein
MVAAVDYRVISADDHIDLRWLPRDLWARRLPAALRERAPRVDEADNGPVWSCEGKRWGPWGAYTAAQGSGAMWAIEVGGVLEEGVLRPTTPELRLADMDRDSVDATVMYGPTSPLVIEDAELREAAYAAYNDWLVEFCSARPERLIGVAQLPVEDPAAATRELRRVAKLGLRHANVLAARAEPVVYDEAWEPFWAAAEETGLPVGMHLAVEVKRERPSRGALEPAAISAISNVMVSLQLIDPIVGLIFSGVLDRYPKLKLVMAESDIAWVPYMLERIDGSFRKLQDGRRVEGTGPKRLPSDYFRDRIWMTFQEDAAGIEMLRLLPEDRVMWASDYPHPASTWPYSQRVIEAQMQGLPDGLRRKLLCANAQALYGLQTGGAV